ncbi:MAG: hypothetical protein QOI69_3583, partial [Pseudonocardiales bacterium]|nr:hypothetical protein [Pseudonocardiales bacterium]
TLASSAATPPIEPASTATLRIDVSPARVAVTRTDIAPTATVTVADATHRGGYFHLGRRAAAVRFSDIAIS